MNKDADTMTDQLERFREALAEPRSLRYLTSRFNVSRKTIADWRRRLEAEGVTVVCTPERPARYWIP